ncbi:hypothetical protein [Alkalihalophilus marmarensis]|uniref:hypothetical protein n=1 Tax=Alkalihalophilus marmarensis TaxID=521377 RepID=UPI002E2300A7|nr:hypothetical protein [Alkalihalophilus marmarensis]
MSDNRTLRKVFDNLYENNLIIEPILKFPNRSAMTVSLNPEYAISSNTRAFTQLDARVFNKSILAHIGATGVRMLYYYQSRINYKSLSTDHCFAAVKTIAKEIGVSKETVIKYNEILESTKLIKIIKHKLDWSGGYNEFGFEDYTRYNNHTYINEENIPKLLVELSKTSEF